MHDKEGGGHQGQRKLYRQLLRAIIGPQWKNFPRSLSRNVILAKFIGLSSLLIPSLYKYDISIVISHLRARFNRAYLLTYMWQYLDPYRHKTLHQIG